MGFAGEEQPVHAENSPRGSLRLRDDASGRLVALAGSRSRLVRIRVAPDRGGWLETLRAALTADAIRRVLELRGGQAQVAATEALPDLLAYNIHPTDTPDDGAVADVVIGRVEAGRLSLHTGPVEGSGMAAAAPLSVRLLLLGRPYVDAVRVDAREVASAQRRLHRWRDLVAGWAGFSSAAMPHTYLATMLDRAGDNLDLPGVVALLDHLAEDADEPPGARFEFFLYADRLLGLDLAAHLSS